MADLWTPKQVIMGDEPEELAYEFPVSYDKITNNGFILLLDAGTNPKSLYAPDHPPGFRPLPNDARAMIKRQLPRVLAIQK